MKMTNWSRFLSMLLAGLLLLAPLGAMADGETEYRLTSISFMTIRGEEVLLESTYVTADCPRGSYGGSSMFEFWTAIPNFELEAGRIHTSDIYTYYVLDDGTAAIIDIDPKYQTRKLVIPDSLDGCTVTRFGLDADIEVCYFTTTDDGKTTFTERDWMLEPLVEELILPDSVKVIGARTLPSYLKKVTAKGVEVFGCQILQTQQYLMGKGLKELANFAFAMQEVSKKQKLPDGLEKIGAAAFAGISWGQNSFTIPASVKEIGSYTFAMSDVKTVQLKNGVPYIPEGMCLECEKLTSMKVPASVAYIGDHAFDNCAKLESVTFDAKNSALTTIGSGAFVHCTKLKTIVLPEGVTTIGEDAFFDCAALANITIPSTVTSIGDHAFRGISDKATFTVTAGSYGETWANEQGVKTKVKK